MKNRYVTILVSLCLMYPALARGQDPATTAGPKIGVINIQAAIATTAQGKQALSQLDAKYAPKRDELQREQQQINALQDQLQRQSATLSDEERVRLTRELDEKNRRFKQDQENDQADYQADSNDAVQRIGQRMVKVISAYAAENGYSLVIDPTAVQMPVYYVAKGLDITEPIVKLYDQANPVTGSSATKTAKPAAAAPKKP